MGYVYNQYNQTRGQLYMFCSPHFYKYIPGSIVESYTAAVQYTVSNGIHSWPAVCEKLIMDMYVYGTVLKNVFNAFNVFTLKTYDRVFM
jgi:hypothetical protein